MSHDTTQLLNAAPLSFSPLNHRELLLRACKEELLSDSYKCAQRSDLKHSTIEQEICKPFFDFL